MSNVQQEKNYELVNSEPSCLVELVGENQKLSCDKQMLRVKALIQLVNLSFCVCACTKFPVHNTFSQ